MANSSLDSPTFSAPRIVFDGLNTERRELKIEGETLVSYWHWPEVNRRSKAVPPVILMGHGFATEWHFGTEGFIRGFVAAGFVVVNFDYRHYGESSGLPRQLIDVAKQHDDWRAVLLNIREEPRLHSASINLWGSSFGGGHALTIAAENLDINAVVAQVPYVDAKAAYEGQSITALLSATGAMLRHALMDKLKGMFGDGSFDIPLFNEHDDDTGYCVFKTPGWRDGYWHIVTAGTDWQPAIPARSLLSIPVYNPKEVVANIHCPALLMGARLDQGTPAKAVKAAAALIRNGQYVEIEGDHFDAYTGSLHADVLQQQISFLTQNTH